MTWIIVGRVLQGRAPSRRRSPLAADLTREEHRTKVMAMIGSSIGLVFALSLVGALLLYGWIGMGGLFIMTGVLALAAIVLLLKAVPPPRRRTVTRNCRCAGSSSMPTCCASTSAFSCCTWCRWPCSVVLPHALVDHGGLDAAAHWKVYLPAVLVSSSIMVPAIIAAERMDKMRPIFLAAVGLLVVVQGGLYLLHESPWVLALWLLLFFVAFNVLEATLPSLVSRTAPPAARRGPVLTRRRRPSACSSAARRADILRSISAIMRFCRLHRPGPDLAGGGDHDEFPRRRQAADAAPTV